MRCLLLAAGEDPAEAQLGDGLEGGHGVARHVEGAVKGDRLGLGPGDVEEGLARRHVHVAVDVQAAENESVDEAAEELHVAPHHLHDGTIFYLVT